MSLPSELFRLTTDAAPRTLYRLHPKQQEAMRLLGLHPATWATEPEPVEELLFGGEAGGGKSACIRAIASTLALLWPGSRAAIFRRTYPELEDTHIAAIRLEWPDALGKYNAERHEYTWKNGSITQFRYAKEEADVYSYQSAEWAALLIDEATHFTEKQIRYLKTRVRVAKPAVEPWPESPSWWLYHWRPVIVYATNPGNVGHSHFKREYVDPHPAGVQWRASREEGGLRRCFLRARLADNPNIDPDQYRRMLEGVGDETLRRALLDGDWDIFSGQFFKEWRRHIHVCEPFGIPADWPRFVTVDYGYADPCAAYWAARNPDTKRLYIYREFYQKGLRDEEQAKRLVEWSKGEKIKAWILDPSMFNTRGERNQHSIARSYRKAGIRPILPASNARKAGWQALRALLAYQENPQTKQLLTPPRLQVFSTCVHLIRSLPEQVHDPVDVEDLADRLNGKRTEDHAADACRYLAQALSGKFAKIKVREVEFGN